MGYKERRKVVLTVFKESAVGKLYLIYLIFFFFIALAIMLTDKGISNYPDALWYCFVSCTTIGFGDIAAAGLISRLLTVVLYLYTVGLLAITTALITQIFFEIMKVSRDESVAEFLYDLEHLPDLSKEELEAISLRIKKKREQS